LGAPEGCGRGWGPRHTSLGDMPESCVAAVLLYLDPAEICQVALLAEDSVEGRRRRNVLEKKKNSVVRRRMR
jgi:hypothetical protein